MPLFLPQYPITHWIINTERPFQPRKQHKSWLCQGGGITCKRRICATSISQHILTVPSTEKSLAIRLVSIHSSRSNARCSSFVGCMQQSLSAQVSGPQNVSKNPSQPGVPAIGSCMPAMPGHSPRFRQSTTALQMAWHGMRACEL